jgi:hypothetical protein
MTLAGILDLMPDAIPPPITEDEVAEAGWYSDPYSPELLRWWDGDSWSDDAVKPVGEDGYPVWHPEFLRERIRLALECCAVWITARLWRG